MPDADPAPNISDVSVRGTVSPNEKLASPLVGEAGRGEAETG